MMRVMFVDDEPNILSGLRRILRPMKDEWAMVFAESGTEALEQLDENNFDVIVSDMKMPGMDGAVFLSEVKDRYPEAIRIALSGQTDSHMIYRCVEHAHQYMSKPCEVDVLIATVKRACKLRELMDDEKLKSLVSSLTSLPSQPEAYKKIMQELQSDDPSLQEVGKIVESDIAMSAKILQLVNSAFFGLVRHLSSPGEAASFLGVDVIKSLVLTTGVFSQFDAPAIGAARIQSLWTHGTQVGYLAKAIAERQTEHKILGDYAFMGGLLMDVGKLIFAANLSDEFARSEKISADEGRPDWVVEREVFGRNHMDVGAYLIGLWGLPNPVVECVAYHHIPGDCVEAEFSALSAVHIAHAIVGGAGKSELTEIDEEYVVDIGVADEVSGWVDLYNEMAAAEGP